MLRGAIVAPIASPNLIARATAPRLSTGNVPGSATSIALACEFRAAPNAVDEPEKILLAVVSCACVSSPITSSQDILIAVLSEACPKRFRAAADALRAARDRRSP